MKEANKTRGIKNRKAAFLAVIASLVLAACCLPIAQASWRVKAEETADSQAFFLTEDRTTQGFWYNLNLEDDDPNNDDGLLEHVDNRNYGKDGLVLFHHWLRQNGQQESNVSKLNDFADNHTEKYYNGEKVNYVEYPSYVSDIKGNIDAFNGTFRYWMNTPQTFSQTLLEALGGVQPLPIEGVKHDGEEFTWSHGGFSRELGGTTRFDVTVTDDDWHTVSYYLGWAYRHKYMGDYDNIVRIYAPDGKLLAEHTVPLANQGVYARFAVKGSFTVELEGVGYAAYSNGLFFDAVPTATVLGTEGLTATLTPPRTVTLNWTNKTAAGGEAQTDMVTSVYRRIKGGLWDRIAELDSDVTTYTDTDTNVAAEYEYVLASGYRDTFDPVYRYAQIKNGFVQPKICVTDYQAPDFTAAKSVETAPYTLSEARSQDASFAVAQNETFTVRVDLVKTDDGKDVAYENKTWDAFADHEVKFTLEGENVIAGVTYDGAPVYNMERNLGQVTTDGEGYAELECSIPYVGEYEVVVSTEPQAKTDPVTGEQDPMKGYDGATARIRVSVRALPSVNPETPVLFSITDSVRAGDTVNLTGYNVRDDGEFTVAFVKNKGHEPTGISKDDKVYALDRKDIIFTDELNGTGMMFKFPENLEAGTYDFYIKNSKGYSNGVTLNAARPLYLDQEGAYEGQEIQIVGRNFLQNEFGVGDLESAYDALRVKLTQVADANGAPVEGMSYYLSAKNGGILTGLKLRKEDAVAFEGDAIEPEDIPYTNPYRITVKIPAVYDFGTYEVSVANDGKDFRKLSDHCLLTIYEKKAQNWDTDVFGEYGDAHVGNDPLDLGVYWAQDLNYTNIATFDPDDERNTFERAAEFKKHINDTITKLSNAGGGCFVLPRRQVLHFLRDHVPQERHLGGRRRGQDRTGLRRQQEHRQSMVAKRRQQ